MSVIFCKTTIYRVYGVDILKQSGKLIANSWLNIALIYK